MQLQNDFDDDPPTVVAGKLQYVKPDPPRLERIILDPSENLRFAFSIWWTRWNTAIELIATVSVVPLTFLFMWLCDILGEK